MTRASDDRGERAPAGPLTVIVSAHARQQIAELGQAAERAVEALADMDAEEIGWMAEPLPPQQGRSVWLLWAGGVRILFDIEDSDLTVHGVGLRPHSATRSPHAGRRRG